MEQSKNTAIGWPPGYSDLQAQVYTQQSQIEILKEMVRSWEELATERVVLIQKANDLIGPASVSLNDISHKLAVEERHSEKRRVEIMRMQGKLRARRQQVKHLLEVIDILQKQPHVQGNPSAVGRKSAATMQHVNHGQKGSWTYRYDNLDDTIYLQVDAQAMTTSYLEELLKDLQEFKSQISILRKSLKVDIADVSVLTNALRAKGYNDEAIRDLIKTIKEVK